MISKHTMLSYVCHCCSVEIVDICELDVIQMRPLRIPVKHLFCDIAEFISQPIRQDVLRAAKDERWIVPSLKKWCRMPGNIQREAYCSCECEFEFFEIRTAGTPCIDHSNQPGGL